MIAFLIEGKIIMDKKQILDILDGVTGTSIDYEHIKLVGSNLCVLFRQLFQDFFEKFSVCDDLKVGVILPLFKGKGAKANNKDNYRDIVPQSL